jgi:uncharacterized OsmC-like protein
VRDITAADNLVAEVEGEIEDVDGVIRITAIRLVYRLRIRADERPAVERVLAAHAAQCPAYQSVKGCIDCSWELRPQID